VSDEPHITFQGAAHPCCKCDDCNEFWDARREELRKLELRGVWEDVDVDEIF
jgi:hypothetical protein